MEVSNVSNYPKTLKLNNGQEIPLCGFGTYKGDKLDEVVYEAIKLGVRLFDTAWLYQNEKEVGQGLAKAINDKIVARENLFVVTKIWITQFENPEEVLRNQLKDLQLDYVDCYLVHWPNRVYNSETKEFVRIPMHKLWANMESLVKKGLTKSIGISNFNVQLTMDLLTYCEIKPVINQIEFHPYLDQTELLKFLNAFDIATMAYNSLCMGDYKVKNSKFDSYKLLEEKVVLEVAEKHKRSPGQIVLSWAITKNVIVIPKSSSVKRVKENYESVDFRLDNEDLEKLSKLNTGVRFNETQGANVFGYFDVFA